MDPVMLASLRRDEAAVANATVRWTRPDPGDPEGGHYDDDGKWIPATIVVHEGWAIVDPLEQQDRQHVQAHGVVSVHRYQVTVEQSPGVDERDTGEVLTSTEDADLVGTRLRVKDVLKDSSQVNRGLVCEEVTGEG